MGQLPALHALPRFASKVKELSFAGEDQSGFLAFKAFITDEVKRIRAEAQNEAKEGPLVIELD